MLLKFFSSPVCLVLMLLPSLCTSESETKVLCPGLPPDDFCDCDGECNEKSAWCACDEALTCCGFSVSLSSSPIISSTPKTVLCPGLAPADFCDCDGDCFDQPAWCACDEAVSCCKNATHYSFSPSSSSQKVTTDEDSGDEDSRTSTSSSSSTHFSFDLTTFIWLLSLVVVASTSIV